MRFSTWLNIAKFSRKSGIREYKVFNKQYLEHKKILSKKSGRLLIDLTKLFLIALLLHISFCRIVALINYRNNK